MRLLSARIKPNTDHGSWLHRNRTGWMLVLVGLKMKSYHLLAYWYLYNSTKAHGSCLHWLWQHIYLLLLKSWVTQWTFLIRKPLAIGKVQFQALTGFYLVWCSAQVVCNIGLQSSLFVCMDKDIYMYLVLRGI